jgi:hypothetical protein
MCFLIAKKMDDVGCIALQIEHGKPLADLKQSIYHQIGYDSIQLVTISRSSAYGEYEPYQFVDSPADFEARVLKMV